MTDTYLVSGVLEMMELMRTEYAHACSSNIIALTPEVLECSIVNGWSNVQMPHWLQEISTFNYDFEIKLRQKLAELEKRSSEKRSVIGASHKCSWNYYYNYTLFHVSKACVELADKMAPNLIGIDNLSVVSPKNAQDYYFDSLLQPLLLHYQLNKSGISCKLKIIQTNKTTPYYREDAYHFIPESIAASKAKVDECADQSTILISPAALFYSGDQAKLNSLVNELSRSISVTARRPQVSMFPSPYWQVIESSPEFNSQISVEEALRSLPAQQKQAVLDYANYVTTETVELFCALMGTDNLRADPFFANQIKRIKDRLLWQSLIFVFLNSYYKSRILHSTIVTVIDAAVSGPIQSVGLESGASLFCLPHSSVVNLPTNCSCSVLTDWWTPHHSVSLFGDANRAFYFADANDVSIEEKKDPIKTILFIHNGFFESLFSSMSFVYLREIVQWLQEFANKNGIQVIHRFKPGGQNPFNAFCQLLGLEVEETVHISKIPLNELMVQADLVLSVDEPTSALWKSIEVGLPVLLIADRKFVDISLIDNEIISAFSFADAKDILSGFFCAPETFEGYRRSQCDRALHKKNRLKN